MSLFDKVFGRRPRPGKEPAPAQSAPAFKTFTAYRPVFTTWGGQLYESDLVRAAVDTLARHSAKLEPTFQGTAHPKLRARIKSEPNPFQTWSQFLYRTRTILEVQNTAFIVPVLDSRGTELGWFTVLPSSCEAVEVHGEPWLRMRLQSGDWASVPLDEVGVLTRHQYRDDLFGETNGALNPVMELLQMQRQGIEEGIQNGATFRFMAQLGTLADPEDLAQERLRFNANNLRDESGGLLLFPAEYKSIQQINQQGYHVDAAQMEMIRQSVFDYFGVNGSVLQNSVYGDKWAAFYEGAIEPFAIQLSEVMTAMTFSQRERTNGNKVFFTSNRLQYMTNSEKTNVTALLTDRGIFSRNEARAVWNLPPIEGGDDYVIRGEYKAADSVTMNLTEMVSPPGGTAEAAEE